MKGFLSCVVTLWRRTTTPSKRSFENLPSLDSLHTPPIRCGPSTELKPLFCLAAAHSSYVVYGLSLSGGRLRLRMDTGDNPCLEKCSRPQRPLFSVVTRSRGKKKRRKHTLPRPLMKARSGRKKGTTRTETTQSLG